MIIREAQLAGSWYPYSQKECIAQIESMNKSVKIIDDKNLKYIAGIVPHAGWFFSGSITNNVFHNIYLKNKNINLVILYGGHFPASYTTKIMAKGVCETPLGNIEIDVEAANFFKENLPDIEDENYNSIEPDNTIELQLPFIKYYFNDAKMVPLRVGANKLALEIGRIAAELKNKYNAIFIGSTDLTHYGMRYGFSPAGKGAKALNWVKEVNDKRIIDLSVNAEYTKILDEAERNSNACCPGSLTALLATVHYLNIQKGYLIEYKTSYDIAPEHSSPSEFVGYEGVIF